MSPGEYHDTAAQLVAADVQDAQRFNERIAELSAKRDDENSVLKGNLTALAVFGAQVGIGAATLLILGAPIGLVGGLYAAFAIAGGVVGATTSLVSAATDTPAENSNLPLALASDPLALLGGVGGALYSGLSDQNFDDVETGAALGSGLSVLYGTVSAAGSVRAAIKSPMPRMVKEAVLNTASAALGVITFQPTTMLPQAPKPMKLPDSSAGKAPTGVSTPPTAKPESWFEEWKKSQDRQAKERTRHQDEYKKHEKERSEEVKKHERELFAVPKPENAVHDPNERPAGWYKVVPNLLPEAERTVPAPPPDVSFPLRP